MKACRHDVRGKLVKYQGRAVRVASSIAMPLETGGADG